MLAYAVKTPSVHKFANVRFWNFVGKLRFGINLG